MDTDTIIEGIAADQGIPAATIRKWRSRGKVPHHARLQIIEAAHGKGFVLRTSAFDAFGNLSAEKAVRAA